MSTVLKAERRTAPAPAKPRRPAVAARVPYGALSLLGGAIIWELLARLWDVSFFPPLTAVLARLWQLTLDGEILPNLANSLLNLVIGFGIAVVLGVGIGLLMGAYAKVEAALDLYVYAFLTAPSLIFAPIFFSLFGLGRAPIIGVIIMYAVFIIIINTAGAIRSVPVSLIEMGRSFCASDRQIFRRIVIPAAMPLIMAGIRLGMGRAVKGMINGEMFIAAVGLGAVVINAGKRFDAETVLAVLLVIVAVAFVTIKLVQLIDRRVTSWLPSTFRS